MIPGNWWHRDGNMEAMSVWWALVPFLLAVLAWSLYRSRKPR